MATIQSFRKAFGALKDTTTVGLAHVNSDYADLDVAIVKATNHVECPPKERHLRKLLVATSSIRPRADVAYCIHGIATKTLHLHSSRFSLSPKSSPFFFVHTPKSDPTLLRFLRMATIQSFRKAFGALKDTTTVGLAHVNSDYADLDVAIVKATNHVECPPKERHLRKLLVATSSIRPRADVAYCIHGIATKTLHLHSSRFSLSPKSSPFFFVHTPKSDPTLLRFLRMATIQSFRKAFGALKDTTTVGLAHVNSDYADLDVAIVKATNHVECPPKERHLRKLLVATSSIRPRADVAYCIHGIARRLSKTHNWIVALKTLIVIHRTLREGDPTFREELLNFSLRGRILQLSNFKDDSSPIAWDCSAWVRTYALFLEERLECFRVLKYDIESERLPRPEAANGQGKGYSKTRDLGTEELLEHLPALQRLLHRLIGCQPEGAVSQNYVIQYALALVLKESFKIYCATNDGIINLIDKFFEMPRHEAITSLEIYKRAGLQATTLSNFYDRCRGMEFARKFQFPVLKEPPQSFLSTMEEYISEAPSVVAAPRETLEFPEMLRLTYVPDDGASSSYVDSELPSDEYETLPADIVSVSKVDIVPPQNHFDDVDLLGFDFNAPDAFSAEQSNASALAIVPSDTAPPSLNPDAFQGHTFDSTGWELALATAPSSNLSASNEQQLAGGLNSLTLNSLYDQAGYIPSQQILYGTPAPNPFEVQEPFPFSNGAAPAPSAQMPAMDQQQEAVNPFGPYQPTYHQLPQPHQPLPPQTHKLPVPPPQQQGTTGAPNPFEDSAFEAFPENVNDHQHTNNPFGSPGIII